MKTWNSVKELVEAASAALPEGWVWADKAALESEYAVPNAFSAFRRAVEARLEREGDGLWQSSIFDMA